MKDIRKFIVIFMVLITLIFVGTIGYRYFLDVSIIDALYMTVITISTVGYSEVAEMSADAKLFTMLVIFLGLLTCI
ncbi:MAG: ion channel [Clostridiaceae bacterium]